MLDGAKVTSSISKTDYLIAGETLAQNLKAKSLGVRIIEKVI